MDKHEQAINRMVEFGFGAHDLDFIFSDWENMDEHLDWLLIASKEDIIDWMNAGNIG